MKKLFIAVALVVATGAVALAQKPVAGAKGFTFGVEGLDAFGLSGTSNAPNGSGGSLLFRYYVADGLAARIGLNYEKSGSTVNSTPSTGESREVKTKNSAFGLSLGIQKSLGEGEKLEPYVGADLLVGRTGGKTTDRSDFDATHAFRAAGDFDETETETAPVMTLGLMPVVGFNYFFAENFAFGAEFGWAITRNGTGTADDTFTQKVGGSTTATTTTSLKSHSTNIGTGSGASGKITVSVFF